MAPLDRILLIVFSTLALAGAAAAALCIRAAMRAAARPDGELAMVGWAAGALLGLTVAGMSTAYILLPLLLGL
jgi:hypothetical protein